MASSTGTKCPVCGKSVAVGLVSQTLLQHEDKNGQYCRGSGKAPVVSASRAAAASRSTPSGGTSSGAAKKSSPATKGGVSVRRVEVDAEALREREERTERLRQERAEAARARNDVNVSYFDEPGV
jgi:hypothetical protein